MKYKTKSIIKKVALALAGIVAVSAVGVGVAKLVEYMQDDLKTISPSFDVGNLGADGKYVNDESTLYTKEAFQCDGLQIKLDFDNEIDYQIFFYDDLDNFVESTEVLSAAYSETVHDGYARIVIMPTNDEDDKIGLTERLTYPGQMTIKVAKEQNVEYYNVFNKRLMLVSSLNELKFLPGSIMPNDGEPLFSDYDHSAVTSRHLLDVDGSSGISFNYTPVNGDFSFLVFQFKYENGEFIYKGYKQSSLDDKTVDFYDGITHILISCFIWDDIEDTYIPIDSDLRDKLVSYFILQK